MARKATSNAPRASKIVVVNGIMLLEAVPQDDAFIFPLVAALKAPIIKEAEAMLVSSVLGRTVAYRSNEGSEFKGHSIELEIRHRSETYIMIADQARVPPRINIIGLFLVD